MVTYTHSCTTGSVVTIPASSMPPSLPSMCLGRMALHTTGAGGAFAARVPCFWGAAAEITGVSSASSAELSRASGS
eukprot:5084954-Pyramimonas_sp.AAC.1